MSKNNRTITNGQGAYRTLPAGEKMPRGWEYQGGRVSHLSKREATDTKSEVMAELDKIGIPYNTQWPLRDLRKVLRDYHKANPKEG